MMLTTKGRYAVTSLLDIASIASEQPVKLSQIALRQNISARYLEQIFNKLKTAGLVRSVKGPGGGYLLARSINQINIKEIIDAVGERVEMTRCGNNPSKRCVKKSAKCFTHDLWSALGSRINSYLSSISIKDVMENNLLTADI